MFFAKQIHCSLTGKSSQEHFSVRDLPKLVTFHECAVKMKNVTKKSATEIQEHGNWGVLGDFFHGRKSHGFSEGLCLLLHSLN